MNTKLPSWDMHKGANCGPDPHPPKPCSPYRTKVEDLTDVRKRFVKSVHINLPYHTGLLDD
jgi:hypothetical protein